MTQYSARILDVQQLQLTHWRGELDRLPQPTRSEGCDNKLLTWLKRKAASDHSVVLGILNDNVAEALFVAEITKYLVGAGQFASEKLLVIYRDLSREACYDILRMEFQRWAMSKNCKEMRFVVPSHSLSSKPSELYLLDSGFTQIGITNGRSLGKA